MPITVTTQRHGHIAEIRFTRLAAADAVVGGAHAMAREIAANGPLAVVAMRQTWLSGLAAAMAHEHARHGELRGTADYAEGVAAVFERRPASFIGR